MRFIAFALVGLVIFVNQPGTIIVVGDGALNEIENYQAEPSFMHTGNTTDTFLQKLMIPGDSACVGAPSDMQLLPLGGLKRGPVK